jgi:hypothetical protein
VEGAVLRAWLGCAVPALEAARERIDAVNVFPVADGDTGTNVLLTVRGAADAVGALDPAAPGTDVLRALSRGALLAARGNSGVILSRYLGGLAEAPDVALPEALRRAAEAARTAVHEPEDGTVLTVAAHIAAVASAAADSTGTGETPGGEVAALAAGVDAGRAGLAGISAAHPVLRATRVVDAGACALLVVLDALVVALDGREGPVDVAWLAEHAAAGPAPAADPADRAFEVMAVLHAADAEAAAGLRDALAAVGAAVAVVEDHAVLTAHVHADDPVAVLEAVGACGGSWTASVRTLVGAPRPVVACTAHPALAGALALAGSVALVLPDGVPAPDVRAAVLRAAQDALAPAHAPGAARGPVTPGETTTGAATPGPDRPDASAAPVVVLRGDRLAADVLDALDPAWAVPGWASDDLRVLAAASAGPDVQPATAVAADPDAALTAAERLLGVDPSPGRLVVLLGPGARADDGLDLADRLGAPHPGLPVTVAGPVPTGPAFAIAVTPAPALPAAPATPATSSATSSDPRAEARP